MLLIACALLVLTWWRPFPCRSKYHLKQLENKWAAWYRGELSESEILRELTAYAEIAPSLGERSRYEEKGAIGGYFGVRHRAITHLGELESPQAFDLLCHYATCNDRVLNRDAVTALERRGDKRALPTLARLLEIEDERTKRASKSQAHSRHDSNRHLLTGRTLRAMTALAGKEALPYLEEFTKESRYFERQVKETISSLESSGEGEPRR